MVTAVCEETVSSDFAHKTGRGYLRMHVAARASVHECCGHVFGQSVGNYVGIVIGLQRRLKSEPHAKNIFDWVGDKKRGYKGKRVRAGTGQRANC